MTTFAPSVQCEEGYVGGTPQRRVFYMPCGNESGAQAIVRQRYYWKNYPSEIEIAEEFRLFWNLYHDKARQIFLHSDATGTEHTVVRLTGSRVEVQLKFLVDFLRAKQMHLALQWEGNYWSKHTLDELGFGQAEVVLPGGSGRLAEDGRGDLRELGVLRLVAHLGRQDEVWRFRSSADD